MLNKLPANGNNFANQENQDLWFDYWITDGELFSNGQGFNKLFPKGVDASTFQDHWDILSFITKIEERNLPFWNKEGMVFS